jgi:hypothetical protein
VIESKEQHAAWVAENSTLALAANEADRPASPVVAQ